jgi:hypothetical protein
MANPGSGLYGSVELSENTGYETGEAPINKALRRRAFASSPLFTDYTVENLIKLAKQVLNSKTVIVSGNKQFPEFNLNYKTEAPNITLTPSGGGGLPGTGFTPNIASPGAGNGITPSALPDIGLTVDDLNSIRKTPVVPGQTDGTQNPADSKVGVEVGDSLSMGSSV